MRQHSNKKVVYLRPKKKSFVSIRMLLILMIIGTMAFIINRYFHVKTCTVTKGVINESYFTDAIIIKNETPISSPTNGKLQLLVKPGERVRVGTPLFIITIDEKQKELYQKEIAEIEDKIVNLQDDIGSSSISLNLLNKSVESTTEKLKDATDSGEFDRVKSLKDELLRLTEEKQKILEYNESNINILEQQLKNLRKKLSEMDIVTYAPEAGVVSFNLDGYEDLLVADRVKDLTYTQLQAVTEDETGKDLPKNIKVNQPVVKIIDNFSWYIAVKLEKQLDEGKNYNINIDKDKRLKARLMHISKEGNIGFFLINTGLEGLLDPRKVRVEIVTATHSGSIIPTTALFFKEGKEGVYILERGKKRFKPIEIIAKNESKMIVNELKPGDKIIVQ